MARSGARRKKKPQQRARLQARGVSTRPAARPSTRPEYAAVQSEMFFPKLRRQAKWMFVFLALVFAVGFVGFGVGSGGSGLDQLWSNLGGGGGSTGTSVGDAQKKIAKGDLAAYKELAEAYRAKDEPDKAIEAGEQYVKFRPKDLDFARALAGDYEGKGARLRNEATAIQEELSATTGGSASPFGSTKLGRALGQGKIDSELTNAANKKLTELYSGLDSAYKRATELYQSVAAANPDDTLLQLLLADAAYQARQNEVALKAYRRVIKLAPDSAEAGQARQQIRLIKIQQQAGNVSSG
jgi:tetratricopeptide (TPR) repeat protein